MAGAGKSGAPDGSPEFEPRTGSCRLCLHRSGLMGFRIFGLARLEIKSGWKGVCGEWGGILSRSKNPRSLFPNCWRFV